MGILEMINERRLEMLKESQKFGEYRGKLNAELQAVNLKMAEMEVELKVLERWEAKLKPKEASPKEGEKC